MEIISLCFERVTALGFLACHHMWRKMADGGAATLRSFFIFIHKKMSLCQILSRGRLSPLFSSPVYSCSHDLANVMSTKKACAAKVVKFQ